MKKLVKLAVATAVVFGASSAMATDLCYDYGAEPGLIKASGSQEYANSEDDNATLGDACCVYDDLNVITTGIVKDAYVTEIYAPDAVEGDDPIAWEKTIKCALPKKKENKQKPNTRKNPKEESALVIRPEETGIQCIAPKQIVEEVEAVEEVIAVIADPDAVPPVVGVDGVEGVDYVPAHLWRITGTDDWQNVVSASGEVSLVCTHTWPPQ